MLESQESLAPELLKVLLVKQVFLFIIHTRSLYPFCGDAATTSS